MNERSMHTGGGAAIGGDVRAGRDFVGRDQITIHVTWQAAPFTLEQAPDLARLRADYLAYLRQAYQHLDFKGLPQVEKIAQQLPLDAVYVPLRARAEMPAGETWLRVAGRRWKGQDVPGEDVEALAELAPHLARLPVAALYPLWRETLHGLAARTRRDLLADLQGLAPVIAALGGAEAVAEILSAIQDVGRWWP